MIPFSRLAVLIFIAFGLLIVLPMALFSPGTTAENALGLLPIIVIAEIIVYFSLTLFSNPRMTLATVTIVAVGMMGVRAIASLLGAALSSLITTEGIDPISAWGGNPIVVLLQAFVLILAAPHFVTAVNPSLIDRKTRQMMAGGDRTMGETATSAMQMDTSPAGGFIQVFSFEELSGVIRKTPGLEGFVITSGEGLVVWRDLPIRLELDMLAARLSTGSLTSGGLLNESGLGRLRQAVYRTRQHMVCFAELNANFGLILIYQGRISLSESDARMDVVVKTAREFLQWKYPGLSVTGSLQKPAEAQTV